MEQDEKDYTKGFNNGYILAQHQPELINKVAPSLDRGNPYCDGLLSGKEEYELEHTHRQVNELSRLRNDTKDRGIDLER